MCLWAQKVAAPTTGTTTTPTTGGTTGTTTPAPVNPPATTPAPTTSNTTTNDLRPIFLSGKVMTDDGSPLPSNVNIQSVCNGTQRTRAHAGPNGDFGFQWNGSPIGIFEDASEGGHGMGMSSANSGSSGAGGSLSRMTDPLANCELQAQVSGYTSVRVSLIDRRGQETYDVGTITIHRMSGDEGRVVSALALRAPKDAKKNFDKGTELARANKTEDAATAFRKAVASYPQYADAWLGLGRAEKLLGSREEARTDFQKAIDLDDKLVGPWQEMGYMASDQMKWEEAARYLDHAVRLDPMDSPKAWYFSAMANFNLGRYEVAERNVRAELKLEPKNPHGEYLLGLVLIARKDLQGGADALRNYIGLWPNGDDVESAKKQLSRVESQIGR
jgi:tetratricopeptide (TPR) repeat protein